MKLSKALTWDDLAKIYNEQTGQSAYTKEMDLIFDWAEKQTDKFHVDKINCTIHQIIEA